MFGLQKYFPNASRLVFGCMGLGGSWDATTTTDEQRKSGFQAIDAALEQQINIFDHADIYTRGKAEQLFGEYLRLNSGLREKLILQSKCGIRFSDDVDPGRYDFSADYIVKSVESSLKRLQTDYLDILLLHRPDPLMEPEEVAAAFCCA